MKQTHEGVTIVRKAEAVAALPVRAFLVSVGTTLVFGAAVFATLFILGAHRTAHALSEADQLEMLAARFSAVPGLRARFREEKRLTLLMTPLISEGSLYFSPPHLLLRRIDSPVSSSMLIREGRLSITSKQSQMSIGLDKDPVVRMFVDSLRLILAGNLPGLRMLYEVKLTAFDPAENGAFALSLKPLEPVLRMVLSSIELRGQGNRLVELRIQEVGGDFIVTHFFEINNEHRFESEEIDSIFVLPSS